MKLGIEMFLRAITLLLSNLRSVIWATGPAWAFLCVITSASAFLIAGDPTGPDASQKTGNALELPAFFWTYFMIAQSLNFLTLGYIGPKFHRATLPRNTAASPLPYFGYIFALIKLGLIGLGLSFVASRLISFIAPTIPGPLGDLTLPILFLVAILYILLRLSLILPALSVNRPRGMREAWIVTKPFQLAGFVSLALLITIFAALHSLALLWTDPWVKLVTSYIASWFALMILLSYLNVIYRDARRIENRMAKHR